MDYNCRDDMVVFYPSCRSVSVLAVIWTRLLVHVPFVVIAGLSVINILAPMNNSMTKTQPGVTVVTIMWSSWNNLEVGEIDGRPVGTREKDCPRRVAF